MTYQSNVSGATARSATQASNVSFMSILATSVRTGKQKMSRIRDAKGRKAVLIGCCCGLFISMMMGAATLLVIGLMLGVDIKELIKLRDEFEEAICDKNVSIESRNNRELGLKHEHQLSSKSSFLLQPEKD
uniref:Uncharacterized protein n=1 Tax=Romanomermis culicivorax TaxID=13658 RepID=A0A915HV47_ROMCU